MRGEGEGEGEVEGEGEGESEGGASSEYLINLNFTRWSKFSLLLGQFFFAS